MWNDCTKFFICCSGKGKIFNADESEIVIGVIISNICVQEIVAKYGNSSHAKLGRQKIKWQQETLGRACGFSFVIAMQQFIEV